MPGRPSPGRGYSELEPCDIAPSRCKVNIVTRESLRDPLGSARSHGCVRIDSRAVTWLARHARPGTPVEIR